MRAVTMVGSRLRWREHPDPRAGHGQLLVAVRAAGLNSGDLLQLRGLYPAPPGSPRDILGIELAGEVVAVGDGVLRFAPGDRVMAVVGGGAEAELVVVPECHALPVPAGLGWPEAGAFPEVFTTAHDALFTRCGLRMGERVLVHGAAGGVGIAGVQLAAAAGAHVVATVRAAELRDDVADIARAAGGSVEVIAPEAFTDHGPYDVVLELVGAVNLPGDLEALAMDGRIAVIGVGAGTVAEVDLWTLMLRRGRINGSTLRPRSLEAKAMAARAVEREVLPALAAGRLRVPIVAEFPMADAEAAYDRLEAGSKLGKVVLVR